MKSRYTTKFVVKRLIKKKEMKNLFVLATAMMVAGFVGCAEEDIAPAMNDVKVKFEVADKDGFAETRAVKTAWADGDQIAIFFMPQGSTKMLITENSMDNTLVLTYSKSTGWSTTQNNWGDELSSSASGRFLAIHYRGNIEIGGKATGVGYLLKNYDGGEMLCMKDQPYTITDGVMDLGTLNLTLEDKAVQFSVKDLASNTDDWELAVTYDDEYDELDPGRPFMKDGNSPIVAYSNEKSGFYISNTYANVNLYSQVWMCDAVNGDDRSFFARFDGTTVTEKYIFVLKNKTKDKYYLFTYAPTPFAALEDNTAYLLPPLALEADSVTPATGCLWSVPE